MINFDKIVNKLLNKKKSILKIDDIADIIDPDYSKGSKSKKSLVYKTIYRLKSKNIIYPLKNALYIVGNKTSFEIDEYYWSICHKLIHSEVGYNYLIGGLKSLEINLKDYSIHNKLIVYTKDIQKTITVYQNNLICFKKLGNQLSKKNSSFNLFLNKFSYKHKNDDKIFNIAIPELSLLDSLLLKDQEDRINKYVVTKFLNKHKKSIKRDVLGELVRLKYISSINRLRVISKDSFDDLYKKSLDIIKNEGANCFLTFKNPFL